MRSLSIPRSVAAGQRVLLVSPTSTAAAPTAAPPINLLYLAAALERAGADVRAVDMGSVRGLVDRDTLRDAVRDFQPTLVGVTLFTETALAAYEDLAEAGLAPEVITVAGGPHATAAPKEALAHGFDAVAIGEGEETLVALSAAVARHEPLTTVSGLWIHGPDGVPSFTGGRAQIPELDTIANPLDAFETFPRHWYRGPDEGGGMPAMLLTSRGCPSRCTFCANVAYGRSYRFHSLERVLAEMEEWHAREGTLVFQVVDAYFTSHKKRLLALCDAMERLSFRPMWTCETRIDKLDGALSEAMARAGCVSVAVGLESGDQQMQTKLMKYIDLDKAAQNIRVAKEAGLSIRANFMMGFPGETVAELESTLRYMERIEPWVDLYNMAGIVLPYPGSPLYDLRHEELGYTDWWLDGDKIDALYKAPEGIDPTESLDAVARFHAGRDLSVLDAELVPYSDDVRRAIERCSRFRVAANHRKWTANYAYGLHA